MCYRAAMQDFWHALPQPFFALAPMEDVTDAAFRRLIAEYAAPQLPRVVYTEFTSADGLLLAGEKGKEKLRKKLLFSESERPIVAQLFTASPERMEEAARLCASLSFDGFDINMGCPDKAVEKSGCGAALMKNSPAARELIRAAKRGFGASVSVKTRIGYHKDELDTWLPELFAEEPAAITLHARTRKEMSDVPAHWDAIARAVKIRDELKSATLIIGNGDVRDVSDARAKAADTGCDGVMLGRAVFGNPWIFAERAEELSPRERVHALARHLELFDELLGGTTHYAIMKKHFKAYISGWDGAKELRTQLMETESVDAALTILQSAILSA
jgi:nifR3 family TIM-barrel protein